MNTFSKTLALSGATLTLLGTGLGAAKAETFTLVNDFSGSKTVTVSEDGGKTYFDAYTGRYKGQLGSDAPINIFCVDMTHSIKAGDQYAANTNYHITDAAGARSGNYYQGGLASALVSGDYVTVTAPVAAARAGEVAYLADTYLNASSFSGASGSANVVNNLVALNLAGWDIIQSGGQGLSGKVRVDSAAASSYGSLVNYYETLAAGHADYTSTTASWVQAPLDASGNHMQDYVYENHAPQGTPSPVPEPGMPTFLGCLGLVVGGLLLRRKQAARTL